VGFDVEVMCDLVVTVRAVGTIGYVVKPRVVSDLMHAVAEAQRGTRVRFAASLIPS
jgi:hypothetical protein